MAIPALGGTAALADEIPTAEAPTADTAAMPPVEPAPEAPVPCAVLPPPWAGDAALGYVRTSGNTSTSALNLKLALDYKAERWGNAAMISAFDGSRDHLTTDERYSFADKLNYNLTRRDYAYANASYDNDRFAGIAERYALTLGYGRHVWQRRKQTLDIETGLGGNDSRDQGTNRFVRHLIAALGGKYEWKISSTSQLSQTLRAEYASNNVYVNPITELKLTVIGNVFAAVDLEIRYNSDIPAGSRHFDQIMTFNLGYGFGNQ